MVNEIVSSLEFYWVLNHKLSYFSFWISRLNITDVWYIQFRIKKTIKYWWENSETILNYCVFLIELWSIFLIIIRITENLENKETIIIIRKMFEYSLQGIKMSKTTNCECCKYFWKYNLYCFINRQRAILGRICAYHPTSPFTSGVGLFQVTTIMLSHNFPYFSTFCCNIELRSIKSSLIQ
jgi:hypothetical protein